MTRDKTEDIESSNSVSCKKRRKKNCEAPDVFLVERVVDKK